MPDLRDGAQRRGDYFVDAELVDFVREWYGPQMAVKVAQLFEQDPDNETGFCNSVRRSLTREIEEKAGRGTETRTWN